MYFQNGNFCKWVCCVTRDNGNVQNPDVSLR